MKDFPKTAEQARIDRDATRDEITETLTELSHRLDVKQRVAHKVDDTIDQTTTRLKRVVPDPVATRIRHYAYAVRNNPWPLLAAVVAFLLTIRMSRRHKS